MRPIRVLQEFGVDVFKDSRYDTWVLRVIWTRMVNNRLGGIDTARHREWERIDSLYSFFNHSCEPNATADRTRSTTIMMGAEKDIKKGEEITVAYKDVKNMTLEKREKRRQPWFAGHYLCAKCRREREREMKEKKDGEHEIPMNGNR